MGQNGWGAICALAKRDPKKTGALALATAGTASAVAVEIALAAAIADSKLRNCQQEVRAELR